MRCLRSSRRSRRNANPGWLNPAPRTTVTPFPPLNTNYIGRDPKKFDLAELARVSEGHSGSEIEQAIHAALYAAFASRAELTTQHLVDAINTSPPLSVTMAERVESLRNWATGRCVPAD